MENERDNAIARIRTALKNRTGRTWSVRGGRGTAWGWITITAPPKRQGEYGYLSDEDRICLATALGLPVVHQQGVDIPGSSTYYIEYIDRAEGRTPTAIGTPYWD